MNTKLILAALAGMVVNFLLGWLIYGVMLESFMTNNTVHYEGLMKPMDGSFMVLILLSGLLMSFMIAFIFQRWANFGKFFQGLTAGMLLGFFIGLSFDLYFLAAMNLMNFSAVIADVIASTICTGIVGAVIAWVLGYNSKAAPAQ